MCSSLQSFKTIYIQNQTLLFFFFIIFFVFLSFSKYDNFIGMVSHVFLKDDIRFSSSNLSKRRVLRISILFQRIKYNRRLAICMHAHVCVNILQLSISWSSSHSHIYESLSQASGGKLIHPIVFSYGFLGKLTEGFFN